MFLTNDFKLSLSEVDEMKSVTLFLTIILAITVSSQAQTTHKRNYFLKSHVVKKQQYSPKKDSLLANSLTLKERLMMGPIKNNLYYKIKAPLNIQTVEIKHPFLLKSVRSVFLGWYTNKNNISNFDCGWPCSSFRRPLRHHLHIQNADPTLLRGINQHWLRF